MKSINGITLVFLGLSIVGLLFVLAVFSLLGFPASTEPNPSLAWWKLTLGIVMVVAPFSWHKPYTCTKKGTY